MLSPDPIATDGASCATRRGVWGTGSDCGVGVVLVPASCLGMPRTRSSAQKPRTGGRGSRQRGLVKRRGGLVRGSTARIAVARRRLRRSPTSRQTPFRHPAPLGARAPGVVYRKVTPPGSRASGKLLQRGAASERRGPPSTVPPWTISAQAVPRRRFRVETNERRRLERLVGEARQTRSSRKGELRHGRFRGSG